jgi:molybdopterin converting factor subunit 1
MTVRVKLFAAMRDAAGGDAVDVELPEGATLAALRQQLAARLPETAELVGRAMFAVDNQYTTDSATIPPNAAVACIPPVSGG